MLDHKTNEIFLSTIDELAPEYQAELVDDILLYKNPRKIRHGKREL